MNELNKQRRAHDNIFWFVIIAVTAGLRFLDLGRQSPWIDEIMNWQMAEIHGLSPRPNSGHELTYISQALGLRLFDNKFGLRLYSAIFGTAAVILLAAWAKNRVGFVAGLAAGLLFAISPFAVFHSQDANHYGPLMLAGVLAALSVDWFIEREKPRWGLFLVSFLLCALSIGYHPLGIIVTGAFALLIWIWLLLYPDRLPIFRRNTKAARYAVFSAGAIAGALVLRHFFERARGTETPVIIEARRLGWEWEPWRALLGDLYGAMYHHQAPDTILGVAGFIFTCAGIVLLIRKQRWAGIGCIIVTVATVLPFVIVDHARYFSPRYIAMTVPALLAGISACAQWAFDSRKSHWGKAIAVLLFAWSALFLVRFGTWQNSRLHNDHQPSFQTMEWIRQNTPENSIIMSRGRYSSKALGWLWKRFDMGGRTFIPLNYIPFVAEPAVQQIKETVAETGLPSYYVTISPNEFVESPILETWLAENGERVLYLPSGSPDEYFPFDWSIPVYSINTSTDYSPFALPRDGNATSAILGEKRLRVVPRKTNPSFIYIPGTGGAYDFQLDAPADGIVLSVSIEGEPAGHELIAGIDGQQFGVWSLSKGRMQLAFEHPLDPGHHRFDFVFARPHGGYGPRTGVYFTVREIDKWQQPIDAEAVFATPLRQVRLAAEAPAVNFRLPEDYSFINETYTIEPEEVIAAEKVYLIQQLNVGGLGDQMMTVTAQAGNARTTILPWVTWTPGPMMSAAALRSKEPVDSIRIAIRTTPTDGRRQYVPTAELAPVMVFVKE